ncbi:MAG TPA: hypothetical protein VM537_13195 [Anaerolineae bacterium]|nr:hypothetical protein [Anaerolineae bacterium]
MQNQGASTEVNKFLDTVNPEKRRWVIERLTAKSDAEAARAVDRDPATVCRWPEKKQLDWAVSELLKHPQEQALEILTQAVINAARAKAEGMKYKDKEGNEKWNQAVASEVLNRILGQPVQRSEHSGPGGGPISMEMVTVIREQLQRKLLQEPDHGAEAEVPGDTDR